MPLRASLVGLSLTSLSALTYHLIQSNHSWGCFEYGAIAGQTLLQLLAFSPLLMNVGFKLNAGLLDHSWGNAPELSTKERRDKCWGKNVLVVGGTHGIGRGCALSFAKAGANVWVVGRSRADALVEQMRQVSPLPQQEKSFQTIPRDLMKAEQCTALCQEIIDKKWRVDFVVLTVGCWPDRAEPLTKDGLNKVIALDLVARYAVLEGLVPALAPGASALSVLASTQKMPHPEAEEIKSFITGEAATKGKQYGLMQVLAMAGVSADTMLWQAGSRLPYDRVLGMHPGLVESEISKTALPRYLWPFSRATMGLLQLAGAVLGEEEAGNLCVDIVAYEGVPECQKEDEPNTHYYNHIRECRFTDSLAYNEEFGSWMWSWLSAFVSKKGAEK